MDINPPHRWRVNPPDKSTGQADGIVNPRHKAFDLRSGHAEGFRIWILTRHTDGG